MVLPVRGTAGEVAERIERAVRDALPGAEVAVRAGGPGHFEVRVVAEVFRGRSRVQQHQLVYRAIAPLMAGDDAPVHAIDRLETIVPEAAGQTSAPAAAGPDA